MAKKETAKRKNASDYRKEYEDIQLKQLAIESRIKNRAIELCKQYTDVKLTGIQVTNYVKRKTARLTSGQFYDAIIIKGMSAEIEQYIQVIDDVETHLASLHPHKQMNLYDDV